MLSCRTAYQLIAERDRLNKDLESQHRQVKVMEEEIEEYISQRKK